MHETIYFLFTSCIKNILAALVITSLLTCAVLGGLYRIVCGGRLQETDCASFSVLQRPVPRTSRLPLPPEVRGEGCVSPDQPSGVCAWFWGRERAGVSYRKDACGYCCSIRQELSVLAQEASILSSPTAQKRKRQASI